MSSKLYIISNIELLTEENYNNWCIGISDSHYYQSQVQDSPDLHYYWTIDSIQDAIEIKNSFMNKGMHLDYETKKKECIYIKMNCFSKT